MSKMSSHKVVSYLLHCRVLLNYSTQRAAPCCQLLVGMQPHLTRVRHKHPQNLALWERQLKKRLAVSPDDTGCERGVVVLSAERWAWDLSRAGVEASREALRTKAGGPGCRCSSHQLSGERFKASQFLIPARGMPQASQINFCCEEPTSCSGYNLMLLLK